MNAYVAKKIKSKRGVWQGCPLSMLLFALALEPLANTIHMNTNIIGFRAHAFESKRALYVDDDVCFFKNSVSSIKKLYILIDKFGVICGHKINEKSLLYQCIISHSK